MDGWNVIIASAVLVTERQREMCWYGRKLKDSERERETVEDDTKANEKNVEKSVDVWKERIRK